MRRLDLASRLLAAFFVLCGAAACVPQPGGQCSADTDCRAGTTCLAGLCRPEPRCAQACAEGFQCKAGLCAPDVAPVLTWVTPEDGTVRATGKLSLRVAASGPFPPVSMTVVALPVGSPMASTTVALQSDGAGLWIGEIDSGALGDAAFALTPFARVGEVDLPGPARRLRVDRTGPVIAITAPEAAAGAFRRDETVTLRIRITDAGAGLDRATVALVAPGLDPIALDHGGGDDFSVALPLAKPTLDGLAGTITVRVVARDKLGNASSATAGLPVTRVLWRADLGQGLPIAGTAALDATHAFIGTAAGKVLAVDRRTGVPVWSQKLGGPVTASPARGRELVFAASENGDVVALEAATGAQRWSCPDLVGAARFSAGAAVRSFDGLATGASPEGVVLIGSGQLPDRLGSSYGGVFAVEGAIGFPGDSGARTCFRLAALGGGGSSAAIAADGSIYLGTRGGDGSARARKLQLRAEGTPAWSFHEEWNSTLADDPAAAPAIGGDGSVLFGDASGLLSRFSPTGSPLWTPPAAVGEKLYAAPIVAFDTLLAQGRAGTLAPFELTPAAPATTGTSSGTPLPRYVSYELPSAGDVAATPTAGADGTLYVAAGRSLRALSPRGALLWEAPLEGGATSSSPALGCDGALFVGDGKGGLLAILTDSRGLAPGWPRLGHDARNTGNAASGACE